MKTQVNFVLVREGSSDDGLIPHLRSLLVAAGAGEATGTSRDYTGTVGNKLVKVMEESPAPMSCSFTATATAGTPGHVVRRSSGRVHRPGLIALFPSCRFRNWRRGSWSMRAPPRRRRPPRGPSTSRTTAPECD